MNERSARTFILCIPVGDACGGSSVEYKHSQFVIRYTANQSSYFMHPKHHNYLNHFVTSKDFINVQLASYTSLHTACIKKDNTKINKNRDIIKNNATISTPIVSYKNNKSC